MGNPAIRPVKGASRPRAGAPDGESAIAFGPFRLFPRQRLLLQGDRPVRLGSRAFDILIVLVERPGELVSKNELMARVWPSTFVEPANITVHIAALRRVLGDGRDGHRYLINTPGRGYQFVAPVDVVDKHGSHLQGRAVHQAHNLPASGTQLIGRDDIINLISSQLSHDRLVTVVGPGGVGKSSVALAVAEARIGKYRHGVRLVDLAALHESEAVADAVASALGLEAGGHAALSAATALLQDRQMLLVLDNCEHVVEAAAAVAASLLRRAPRIRILATSREPLGLEPEHVRRLSPLKSPPATEAIAASTAVAFPAVKLFVERASAAMNGFEFTDAEAPIVAEICRKLDGVPLAIELAAARVDSLGIYRLAQGLDDQLRLLTRGRRFSAPRQHTMSASIDWSYCLLTQFEQTILRRASIFAGGFTLTAAAMVTADALHQESDVFETINALVEKSLISSDLGEFELRLHLFGVTREYLQAKLHASGEADMLARRHAEYYLALLESAHSNRGSESCSTALRSEIDNIRAALAWAFGARGDELIGVALAVASAPLWLGMPRLSECRHWASRALTSLKTIAYEPRQEMVLQAALGLSLLFMSGMGREADVALNRAGAIAQALNDEEYLHSVGRGQARTRSMGLGEQCRACNAADPAEDQVGVASLVPYGGGAK